MGLINILKQAGLVKGRCKRHSISFTVERNIDDVHDNIIRIARHHGSNWDIEDKGSAIIETLNESTTESGTSLCEGQMIYELEKLELSSTKVTISVTDPKDSNADVQCESLKNAIIKGKNFNL